MTSSDAILCLTALLLSVSCGSGTSIGGGGGTGGGDTSSPSSPTVDDDNVLQISVNGSLCNTSNAGDYPNKPCVSLTLCNPGTSTCQTVDDILLDTGSFGLRVFGSVLQSLSLTAVSLTSTSTMGECMYFADGTVYWGPVMTADVILGNESAVTVPVQVVDSTFRSTHIPCAVGARHGTTLASSPSDTGFNGILGVGPFLYDCGDQCTTTRDFGFYYSCGTSTCTATTVDLEKQVANPVGLLSQDNNGVIIQLPDIDDSGALSATGYLILGIDTRPNNASSGETALDLGTDILDSSFASLYATTSSGSTYLSVFDTGSNGLYIPSSGTGLSRCTSPEYSDWYCPVSTRSLSATVIGYSNQASSTVAFKISSIEALFEGSSNMVFDDIGGSATSYDWGLPFYFGKTVYVGLAGTSSNLGNGPYVAF